MSKPGPLSFVSAEQRPSSLGNAGLGLGTPPGCLQQPTSQARNDRVRVNLTPYLVVTHPLALPPPVADRLNHGAPHLLIAIDAPRSTGYLVYITFGLPPAPPHHPRHSVLFTTTTTQDHSRHYHQSIPPGFTLLTYIKHITHRPRIFPPANNTNATPEPLRLSKSPHAFATGDSQPHRCYRIRHSTRGTGRGRRMFSSWNCTPRTGQTGPASLEGWASGRPSSAGRGTHNTSSLGLTGLPSRTRKGDKS